MPYAPIIPLIMGAGLGPSTTLAGFSEVTQGKAKEGGKGGRPGWRVRLKLISYVLPSRMYHPQINSPHFSERHPSFLVEGGGGENQTSFLFRQFVFPNARPFTISACFVLPSPRSDSRRPDSLYSYMFFSH